MQLVQPRHKAHKQLHTANVPQSVTRHQAIQQHCGAAFDRILFARSQNVHLEPGKARRATLNNPSSQPTASQAKIQGAIVFAEIITWHVREPACCCRGHLHLPCSPCSRLWLLPISPILLLPLWCMVATADHNTLGATFHITAHIQLQQKGASLRSQPHYSYASHTYYSLLGPLHGQQRLDSPKNATYHGGTTPDPCSAKEPDSIQSKAFQCCK